MANFAVSANEDVITQGRNLLERLAQPGEKQGDVLGRIFDIVEQQEQGETMRQSGIDVQALDSSLANIRTMFLAAATGKEQIVAEKDSKIAEKKAAVERFDSAAKMTAQALKDAQAAKEQADTANSLVTEKDRTIATLADKLSAAEAKIDGYDTLRQKEAEARETIKELRRDIETARADHERALADAEKDRERRISDAEKDAALAVANAVAAKEREITGLLREAEKENARLQARVEILEEQLRAAGARSVNK